MYKLHEVSEHISYILEEGLAHDDADFYEWIISHGATAAHNGGCYVVIDDAGKDNIDLARMRFCE